MTDDERAIRQLVDTWIAATQKGDLRAVLKLMADDVVFMVPGQSSFGKEAFAIGFKQMKDVGISVTSDIQEIEIFDDLAYIRNYLEISNCSPWGNDATLGTGSSGGQVILKQP